MEGFLVTQGVSSVIPLLHHHTHILPSKMGAVNFSLALLWTFLHTLHYPCIRGASMRTNLPISKKETLFDLLITALFTCLTVALVIRPELLAIYQKGVEPTAMLLASRARALMLGFLSVSLISLVVSCIKLWKRQWSVALIWASAISELLGALYFAYFMTRWESLNKDFLRFFRNDLPTWQLIAKAAVVCFLLLTLIGIADDLYKIYRHKEKAR